MPEISLLAALPAAPAAPGPATASTVGVTAAQPTDAQAGGQMQFLAQLKSALASLTSAALPVLSKVPTPQGAQALAGQTAPLMAEKPKDANSAAADHQSDVMPEMLAALGFVPVPPAFQTDLVPDKPRADGQTAAPVAAAQTTPNSPTAPATMTAQPGPTLGGTPPTSGLASTSVPGLAPQHVPPATAAPQAPDITSLTPAQTLAQVAVQADALSNVARDPRAEAPATRQDTFQAVQDGATSQALAGSSVQGAMSTASGRSAGGDSEHSAEKRGAAGLDSAAAQDSNTVLDRSFADVTSGAPTATTGVVAPAVNVQASHVVSQIAHQADLYRQPGSKSIRIQLHPEDLGGVDVTLRYSAVGGIQLHINAEHASTGHLVQAGWTELRDALATQGISPDRMVMSVTAASSSSGLSFSSGNDSGRPDPGVDSFTQGQSSSQQQPKDSQQQQRTNRGWNPLIDPSTSLSDDGTRVAAASAARIDYRV